MLSLTDRQAIARRDAEYLALPLQLGRDPASVTAHLREMVRRLKAGSCRQAVTWLTDLFDRSAPPTEGMACARGCAFCCVQTVVVTPAEAFAVAAQLREQTAPALRDYPVRRLGEPRSDWRPCPFLAADKACAVYDSRPLACHGFISFDLAACIGFFGGSDAAAPDFTPPERQRLLLACRKMLCAAHILAGHGEPQGHELTGAVAAILATPDAEARWHRGENVLKAVPMGPSLPPAVQQEIRQMVALVAPTL